MCNLKLGDKEMDKRTYSMIKGNSNVIIHVKDLANKIVEFFNPKSLKI